MCAIPFSVLRHIEISPRLSPGNENAIKQLPYFSAARVSLQFRNRFWEDESLDGEAWTDPSDHECHHVTADQTGPRGILQAYIGGPPRAASDGHEGERANRLRTRTYGKGLPSEPTAL